MGIEYDSIAEVWRADALTDLTQMVMNNFMQWGQPYDPYDPRYSAGYEIRHHTNQPVIEVSQEAVMLQGYGTGISASDFPVVRRLVGEAVNLSDGIYSFENLLENGIVSSSERTITQYLYIPDSEVSDQGMDYFTSAFVHGEVGFALQQSSGFVVEGGKIVSVNAVIGALDDNFDFVSDVIPKNVNGIVRWAWGPEYHPEGSKVWINFRGDGKLSVFSGDECFGAGTLVSLSESAEIPIQEIAIGDTVLAFDADADGGRGALVPRHVTETYVNYVSTLLDFHGTKVTPGHVTLCGDGKFAGRCVPLIDILRSDGAIIKADGSLVRAATNCPVDSDGDRFIPVACANSKDASGEQKWRITKLRLGTLILKKDQSTVTLRQMLEGAGLAILENGLVRYPDGVEEPARWFGPVPKPEQYVLAKSGLTLTDLAADPHGEEHASLRSRRAYGEMAH